MNDFTNQALKAIVLCMKTLRETLSISVAVWFIELRHNNYTVFHGRATSDLYATALLKLQQHLH
jgi:hypothetical protein